MNLCNVEFIKISFLKKKSKHNNPISETVFNGEILTFKLNETFILNFLWWWWNKTNACIRNHKHNYFNLAHHIICSSTFLNLILIRLNCLCHRTAKGLKKRHWNKKNEKKKKKKRWKKINYLGYITLDILPYDVHEEGGSWICHLLGIVCF